MRRNITQNPALSLNDKEYYSLSVALPERKEEFIRKGPTT
jgi:hypothetical protein